jgi:glycine C-acetyltransferase
MAEDFYARVRKTLDTIEADGLTKPERVILSRQSAAILVRGKDGQPKPVLNFCANNYLGLAGDGRVAAAAAKAARELGAGLSSVRFICGTQPIHKELEAEIAAYLGYEDAILFPAAFDANGGLFEPLLDEQDAIVSDSLNHASIIDGVRLCKAKRYRFPNGDMTGLEDSLREARVAGARNIVIATDGVFSMDGHIAVLQTISVLAEQFGALLMVDDCHATGFLGPQGRGSAAFRGVEGKIDFLTGTFGKALGGAMGGFVAARKEVVALLRQRARPYLFSNALAPAVCAAALEAIRIARTSEGDDLRRKLFDNTNQFRTGMAAHGFDLVAGEHPIVPVMFGDARVAQQVATDLLEEGIYVIGFSYPVVPKGRARIRTQLSAAHSHQDIEKAIAAFATVRDALGGRP